MSDEKWAAVEVMGHRQHLGKICEVQAYGGTFMQIEALRRDGSFEIVQYAAGSIFSYRYVSEEQARRGVVPKAWRACGTFTQPSALPGLCAECGHDEPAHTVAAAQLPARASTPEDDGFEPPEAGDDLPI